MTKAITNKDVITIAKTSFENVEPTTVIKGTNFTVAEFIEKANKMLASFEKKSDSKSKKSIENRAQNEELAKKLKQFMTSGTTYAVSELLTLINANRSNENTLSSSKVSTICRVGVDMGIFTQIDGYKVGGKGRAVKGYMLAE